MTTQTLPWKLSGVKNILFPTDFSEESDHALRYAAALAKRLKATVHVLHVLDHRVFAMTQPFEQPEERRPGFTQQDEIEAAVQKAADWLRENGVSAESHWRDGKTDEDILRLTDGLKAGLVVMGTHARTKPDVTILVSMYLKTMHDIDVPLLGVKRAKTDLINPDDLTMKIDTVLCPCDLSEFSHSALPVAAEWCRHFGSELVIAHVAHTSEEREALKGRGGDSDDPVDTLEVLQHLADGLDGVKTRIVTTTGKPEPELAQICEREGVGLVVMATHGRKPVARNILGSVTEQLLIDLPCPIVTIRPERMAERFGA